MLTPEQLAGARIYDLEQLRYQGAPIHPGHAPGYQYVLHRRHEPGLPERRTSAAGLMVASEHSGTHIDAFCHQAEDLHVFGHRLVDPSLQTSAGFKDLGADTIAPILARGVLIDVAGHLGPEPMPAGREISAAELKSAVAAEGLEPAPGDVVLVRTGNGRLWDQPERYLAGPGMAADASTWLAGLGVRAVGADNVAWDSAGGGIDTSTGTSLPGHVILLVRHGIHILENLFLEDLARDRQYVFSFVCLPLKLRGATGSPVRPIALA